MKLQRTALFGLLSGSLLALPAGATPFAFNARNDAMGGTGVASANYLAAPFYNPALLTRAATGDELGLLLPAVGAEMLDKDELKQSADDFMDTTDDYYQAIKDYKATPTPANGQAVLELNRQATRELQQLEGDTGYLKVGMAAAVALPTTALPGALFINSYADVQAFVDVDQTDFTPFSINGYTLTFPVAKHDLNSKLIVMGASVTELGISLAQAMPAPGGRWSAGLTPKLQELRVINYVANVANHDFDDVSDEQYQDKRAGLNLDAGVAMHWDTGLGSGLVVKNLFKRTQSAPTTANVAATYELGPQPTAALSYRQGGLTLAADLDLVPQKRFTSLSGTATRFTAGDDDIQLLSLGIEGDLLGWAQLRGGFRHDLKHHLDDAFTVGFGLVPFKVFHLDVAGLYGGSRQVGVVVQTAFTF